MDNSFLPGVHDKNLGKTYFPVILTILNWNFSAAYYVGPYKLEKNVKKYSREINPSGVDRNMRKCVLEVNSDGLGW